MNSTSLIHFGIASDESIKKEIYRLRYNIYVEEMGKKISDADHNQKILKDSNDENAVHFYLQDSNGIAACLRTNFSMDASFSKEDIQNYSMNKFSEYALDLSISSKLMIAPRLRNSPALGQLLINAYSYTRNRGVKFDFCNCSSSLIQLYECFGYRRYKESINDNDVGYRIPLVCVLEDVEHLKLVNSPFYRVVKAFENPKETGDWFAKNFPLRLRYLYKSFLPKKELWSFFSSLYERESQFEILQTLNLDEKQKFMTLGSLIEVKSGEQIIRRNDWGESLYMIFNGKADVIVNDHSQDLLIATLTQGDVFGEMDILGLACPTTVIAKEDSQLLIISKSSFEKLKNRHPEIAIKVMTNLMQTITKRFLTVTDKWLSNK